MRTALVLLFVGFAVAARAGLPDDQDPQVVRWEELATTTHKAAQQTNDTKKYEEAAGYYEKWLAKPGREHEGVMAFYYGELLFKLQRYADAARLYERAITVEPKAKWSDEAAYAYVIATKNAVQSKSPDDDAAKPPCAELKPCPIPDDMMRLIAAFRRYLEVVTPTAKDRATMEYRQARVWYGYQHFAEAAPLFDHVFVAYPDNELATYSANLEMDCLANLKRWRDLRALVERIKKSPIMKDATTQQQVREVEAGLKKQGK
jgi:tetratricopeptide (TPR) repeat protein